MPKIITGHKELHLNYDNMGQINEVCKKNFSNVNWTNFVTGEEMKNLILSSFVQTGHMEDTALYQAKKTVISLITLIAQKTCKNVVSSLFLTHTQNYILHYIKIYDASNNSIKLTDNTTKTNILGWLDAAKLLSRCLRNISPIVFVSECGKVSQI